jgi:hypothetical protein
MKTEKTDKLRSAAERRVARGVARVFGAQRQVIIMVKPNRNYNFKKSVN